MISNPSAQDQELHFLAGYSPEDYDRPSLAADIAAFSLQTEQVAKYRNDPEQKLCILLIRRGQHPYKDMWALPGGFLQKSETLEDCAFRELKEETNLEPENMLWVNSYSNPGRDPRGWIISHAYACISTETQAALAASADASDAKWFQVHLSKTEGNSCLLTLSHGDISLNARLREVESRMGRIRFQVLESQGLAFDHAAIIGEAMELLRKEAENIETIFAFLPEKFTLSALQKVQETLMGISLLTPNFRRKIAGLVEETDEYTEGAGHRPAKLFRKK